MPDETEKASASLKRPKKASHTTAGPPENEAPPQAGEEVEEENTEPDTGDAEREEDQALHTSRKGEELAASSATGSKTTSPSSSEAPKRNLAHMLRFDRKKKSRR
jgi:hypothetical protein